MSPSGAHDFFGADDWMIKDKVVGRTQEAGAEGELVSVRLTGQITYFRGKQVGRTLTTMSQPDLGRPLNHA